jgi:hypothetical protein
MCIGKNVSFERISGSSLDRERINGRLSLGKPSLVPTVGRLTAVLDHVQRIFVDKKIPGSERGGTAQEKVIAYGGAR